jgi:hypothetical protein
VYYFAGVGFAALAADAPSHSMRTLWRLAAWAVCAIAFAAHVAYEHFRLRHAPRWAALDAALAVVLGAFGLALRVVLRARAAGTGRPSHLLALALWPLVTAIPAFFVALAAGAALRRREQMPIR